jgi:PHP family Zn ribbon phosphoesterase
LADRAEGGRPEGAPAFRSVIPLLDLICGSMGIGGATKKALRTYFELLRAVGNEFRILLEAPLQEISGASSEDLARCIGRMRLGEVEIDPGYDGRYGKISVSGKP